MANIIFDFDGTIADSLMVVLGIIHELTGHDMPQTAEEVERLRSMTLLQAAREANVRVGKVPFMVARGRRLMRTRMEDITAFKGIPEAITELHAQGHGLYIMSSNSVQNIEQFL